MKNDRNFTRRDFLKLTRAVIQRSIAVGLIGYLYGADVETAWIDTTHVTLKLPRLDPAFHGLRLVQMSDFHVGHAMDRQRLDSVLRLALTEAPDAILLTGDFVDRYPDRLSIAENIALLSGSFSQLPAFCPTFAVLGNHDHLSNALGVQEALTSAGIKVLRNEVTTLERNGRKLHLAGVDDVREKMDRLDFVLTRLPAGRKPPSCWCMNPISQMPPPRQAASPPNSRAIPTADSCRFPSWVRPTCPWGDENIHADCIRSAACCSTPTAASA
jgi:predicted MPP superfamily phosphohydrolase